MAQAVSSGPIPAREKRRLSDSAAQLATESRLLVNLSELLGNSLSPQRIRTGKSFVTLDGFWSDAEGKTAVAVEVYAHIGKVKAAQRHKVQADVLKLSLVRQTLLSSGYDNVRAIFAFVCNDCAVALQGRTWVGDAADQFGIETMVLEASQEERAELLRVQAEQNLYVPETL